MIHMIADSQGTATANAARRTAVRHLLRPSASFGFIPGCPARTRAGKRSKGKYESSRALTSGHLEGSYRPLGAGRLHFAAVSDL